MSISDITHDAYQVFPQQCLLASVLCDEKSMVMYTSYVYTIFVVSACPPCFLSLFFFSDFEKAFSINTPRPLYQKRSTASPSPSSANSLSLSLSGCISPVLHCPQNKKCGMDYNVQYYWNRDFVKIGPSKSLWVVQHSALFHWRRAPHWSLQMTHHARRNSTKSWYHLICSWFGPCLAKIGEIRCTAAMQLYPLHRPSVSSSLQHSRSHVRQFSRRKSRW